MEFNMAPEGEPDWDEGDGGAGRGGGGGRRRIMNGESGGGGKGEKRGGKKKQKNFARGATVICLKVREACLKSVNGISSGLSGPEKPTKCVSGF